MDIIKSIEHEQLKNRIPDLKVGDTVRVHQRIKEGNRERIQVFEGIIIKKQGGSVNATFTVRRIAYGVGVEKTFLVHSPLVEKVEVVRVGKARRAKLYYLRDRVGKAAKTKENIGAKIESKYIDVKEELVEEPAVEEEATETVEAPVEEAKVEETVAPVEEAKAEEVKEETKEEVVEEAAEEKKEPSSDEIIEGLKAELDKAKNDVARAYADTENMKKRLQKDADATRKYRFQQSATEILPILDSMEMALKVQTEDEAIKNYVKGFEMIHKQLKGVLEKEGVQEIDAADKPFDHNTMQALMQEKKEGVESGMVIEVLQKGYMLKDRILRPALVKVSE